MGNVCQTTKHHTTSWYVFVPLFDDNGTDCDVTCTVQYIDLPLWERVLWESYGQSVCFDLSQI